MKEVSWGVGGVVVSEWMGVPPANRNRRTKSDYRINLNQVSTILGGGGFSSKFFTGGFTGMPVP